MNPKLLFPLSGLVLAVSCAVNSTGAPKPTAPESLASQGSSVTAAYQTACAKCHGQNGEGGGGGTLTLLTEDKFDQKWDKPFFDAIKNGVPDMGMEGYGASMTDEQIWGQVVHLRELQARALRAKNGSPKPVNGMYRSKRHNFKVETVLEEGLKTPWGIDWLPDGRMLVTNRPGTMVLVSNGKAQEISGMPESREMGQGGLMEVAVHPNYRSNGWIYLAYTEAAASGRGGMTKIVRGKLNGTAWASQQTIFEADQKHYTGAGVHFGSRITFDKGLVYFAIGERGGNMKAQELDNPFGKVFRVRDDGSIPADNPFRDTPGAMPGIWSYGHRNHQGLAMDANGNLWDTEHGPRGGDEVNRIQKGANYGWPVVAFSINYNDTAFRTPWPKDGLKVTQPVFRWLPSIGASGLDIGRGNAFPNWKGDLFAGGLSGANLDRIRISGDKVVEREELLHGLGRVREVAVGPDGFVYVALNQPDKIIRLVP